MLTIADCMAMRPATPIEIIKIVRKVLKPELRIATRALKDYDHASYAKYAIRTKSVTESVLKSLK